MRHGVKIRIVKHVLTVYCPYLIEMGKIIETFIANGRL